MGDELEPGEGTPEYHWSRDCPPDADPAGAPRRCGRRGAAPAVVDAAEVDPAAESTLRPRRPTPPGPRRRRAWTCSSWRSAAGSPRAAARPLAPGARSSPTPRTRPWPPWRRTGPCAGAPVCRGPGPHWAPEHRISADALRGRIATCGPPSSSTGCRPAATSSGWKRAGGEDGYGCWCWFALMPLASRARPPSPAAWLEVAALSRIDARRGAMAIRRRPGSRTRGGGSRAAASWTSSAGGTADERPASPRSTCWWRSSPRARPAYLRPRPALARGRDPRRRRGVLHRACPARASRQSQGGGADLAASGRT